VPIYLAIEIGELEFAQVFTLQEGKSIWGKIGFSTRCRS